MWWRRLRSNGIRVVFSGLKKQVLDVMRHSGLLTYIGEENIFAPMRRRRWIPFTLKCSKSSPMQSGA